MSIPPLKPITPAPDCMYNCYQVRGVDICSHKSEPCDCTPTCGYTARPTVEAIRKEQVTVEDRLEMMEGLE